MKAIRTSLIAALCLCAAIINAQELVPFGGNSKRPFLNENTKRGEMLRAAFAEQPIECFGISDLTPEQHAAIKESVLAKNKKVIQLNNQLNEKQAQLQSLESSDKSDLKSINKVIDEIGALIASRMKAEAECKQKIRSVLSEEQRVEFDLKQMKLSFSDIISAQNDEEETIIIPDRSWERSRQGEMKHYENYSPVIIPEYFILGTLRSYMGRYYGIQKEDQVDFYSRFEEPMVIYLEKYILEKFGLSLVIEKDEKGDFRTYSPELAKKINGYFDKEGELDIDIFKSNEEIFSFLSGVYYRNGAHFSNSIRKMQFNNSSYNEQVYSFLKKAGCVKIFYKQRKYFIPVTHAYYFEPSVLLEKYFNTIETEREKLYEFYLKHLDLREKERETEYKKEEQKILEPFFSLP